MTKWLFASDIDGTLLHHRDPIPQGVVHAAQAFQRAGGILTLCTGRAFVSTEAVARQLGVEVPCILYGGAGLYDFSTREFLATTPMPDAIFPLMERVLAEYRTISVQAYTTRRNYMVRCTPYVLQQGTPAEQELPEVALRDVQGEVLKLILACEDRATLDECGQHIFTETSFPFAYSSTHFAEVLAPGVSKATMVHTLAERLGVPPACIFSAGDGMTDLPMLEGSAVSFAPQDAPGELLAAASEVIPPAKEGGMVEAFHRAVEIMANA